MTACLVAMGAAGSAWGQRALTWDEVRHRFEATNPTLQAARIGIDEAKAQEVTAYLRPNPEVTTTIDQLDPFSPDPYRPLANTLPLVSASYLHERQHKRELRLESARNGTAIAASQLGRPAADPALQFAQLVRAGAAGEGGVGSGAGKPGVLRPPARGKRRPLPRGRYRTRGSRPAAIAAGAVRDGRTNRRSQRTHRQDPAPGAAERSHAGRAIRCNGAVRVWRAANARWTNSTRPRSPAVRISGSPRKRSTRRRRTIAWRWRTVPPIRPSAWTSGAIRRSRRTWDSASPFPLRIFDRNQGEKARTQLDVQRNERLREAADAQVFSDVDSAWATLNSNLGLLRPYKAQYLDLATSGARDGVVRLPARRRRRCSISSTRRTNTGAFI